MAEQAVGEPPLGHRGPARLGDDEPPPRAAPRASRYPGSVPIAELSFDSDPVRLTHQLFRFPAKLHPPAARALIQRYSSSGDVILDPFVGSGTVLVESMAAGRVCIGADIDPLSVFVSRVKTTPIHPLRLELGFARLLDEIGPQRRSPRRYIELMSVDLGDEEYATESIGLWIPAIPNLAHWFRRYVVIDLARLRQAIVALDVPSAERKFFLLCFAAVLRNASNADPVPVSGLEVTAHMRRLEAAGRLIDPFLLFERKVRGAIRDMAEFWDGSARRAPARVLRSDATRISASLRSKVDCVITSPPYHGAVDYYRHHQLEMYWLGLTMNHNERLKLLADYIGRPKVPAKHRFVHAQLPEGTPSEVEKCMRVSDPGRANAFRHYCTGMRRSFESVARVLVPSGWMVVVVGHSTWNGDVLNTSDLLVALARPRFRLVEQLSYPVRNRYMSYSRHNGANIDREYVLAFRKGL